MIIVTFVRCLVSEKEMKLPVFETWHNLAGRPPCQMSSNMVLGQDSL